MNKIPSFPYATSRDLVLALIIIAAFISAAIFLEKWLVPAAGTALILLGGVIVTTLLTKPIIGYAVAVMGAFAFNILFTAPRYSLHMQEVDEIATLVVFLIIALGSVNLVSRIQQQNSALADAQLRAQLLLSLSHDIKTPLTSVLGNLTTFQSYQQRLTQHEREELINGAIAETERLQHYIQNLLQATRLEYGAIALQTKPTDLVELCRDVIVRFDQQERFELKYSVESVMIDAQRPLLEQALFNLFDNALRYSPAGSIVQIETLVTSSQQYLKIKNENSEKDYQVIKQSFQPFANQSSNDTKLAGTGLGLAVAASIIKAHGASLEVTRSHRSTEFTIRFETTFID
ncbi:MAG TPA: DUF4118 domain-containing protein [Pseudidiomarina sp.]|nr:DUF4118 domain-containing protein [Pseudidiomarina sp.]